MLSPGRSVCPSVRLSVCHTAELEKVGDTSITISEEVTCALSIDTKIVDLG